MDSTGPIFGTSRRTASDADANDGPGPGESLEPAGRSTDNRNVRVLFICTANRIRSPFAEAVATRLVDEHRLPVDISSAGVTSAGEEAAESMVHAALRRAGRATAQELVPPVYGPALDARLLPAAARSLLAHLIKLEAEGAAAREGEHWSAR